MTKIYLLAFLLITSFGFSQSAGDIIITEIMQNPAVVSDVNGEYFELYNTTASAIDINGWTIKDLGADNHIINHGGALNVPANGYLVLGKNADIGTNGGAPVIYGFGSGMIIGNGDDEIILETPGALIIDRVDYDGGTTFPDPIGASMNLDPTKYNDTDNNDGINWCESTIAFGDGDFGSPESVNETCPTLTISESQTITFSLYPNPTATGFVTISSRTNEAITVSVFDVLGKQVISETLNNNRLNVSDLNSGLYILKISQNNNTVTKKLIIK